MGKFVRTIESGGDIDDAIHYRYEGGLDPEIEGALRKRFLSALYETGILLEELGDEYKKKFAALSFAELVEIYKSHKNGDFRRKLAESLAADSDNIRRALEILRKRMSDGN